MFCNNINHDMFIEIRLKIIFMHFTYEKRFRRRDAELAVNFSSVSHRHF